MNRKSGKNQLHEQRNNVNEDNIREQRQPRKNKNIKNKLMGMSDADNRRIKER